MLTHAFHGFQKEWRNDWEQKLHGNEQPQEEQGCCRLAGLAQVELSFAQGAQLSVLPTWEGWVPGNLSARPWCGAVQGAQPVPLASKEQILGICPLAGPKLGTVRVGLSLCPHLVSDARCVQCSPEGIAKVSD